MGAQFGDIFFDSLSRWLRWLGILVIVECFDRFPSYTFHFFRGSKIRFSIEKNSPKLIFSINFLNIWPTFQKKLQNFSTNWWIFVKFEDFFGQNIIFLKISHNFVLNIGNLKNCEIASWRSVSRILKTYKESTSMGFFYWKNKRNNGGINKKY